MEGKDLTQGKLFNNMFKLLCPLLLTNLLNSIYNIVDGIWIGNLMGENGVSAITNCYPLILIVTAISTGLSIATSVLVSQYYGAKDNEKIKSTMGFSYIFSIIIGIATAFIMITTSSLWLKLLNTPEEIFSITQSYLIIYMIGFIFNYFLLIIMEGLRAIGNTKMPLMFVGIGSAINIILEPILIKIGLGVAGAAIATVIAMMISMAIGIIYINKKSELLKIRKEYFKFSKNHLKELLKIGLPVIAEQWLISGVILMEVYISNISGVIGSAAYGVISKLEQVVLVIGSSFKTIATVTVGQFIGNKEIKEAPRVLNKGLKLVIVPTIIIILIVFIFPKQFSRIFVNSEEVILMAVSFLSVVGFAHLLLPTRQLINGFIVGTGHTYFTFFSAVIASIVEVIIIFLLRTNGMEDLKALGFGILTWVLTETILNTIYFFTNRWQKEMIKKI